VVDNTPMSKKNLKVDANNDQRRLDNFLTYKFPNLPKSKIYSMIRKGEIRINSKRCKAQTKISLGDEIVYDYDHHNARRMDVMMVDTNLS